MGMSSTPAQGAVHLMGLRVLPIRDVSSGTPVGDDGCSFSGCAEAAVHLCGENAVAHALGCGRRFCDTHVRGARHACPRDPELVMHTDDGGGTCERCGEPYPCFHAERRMHLLGA